MFLIYTRKSTDDAENQKNSLEYQERMCRDYAKKEKIELTTDSMEGIMKDGVIAESHSAFKASALSVSGAGLVEYQIERPKFMQMISWLLEGKYEGVVVLCWDRISRNEQSDLIVKELIDKHQISFRFVQAEYDHGTSSGALHRDIDGMFARHHSRVTSEKVRAAFRKLREDRRCTYFAPIGYLDEGSDRKVLDPERAPIIRRLFELYAEGQHSLRDLHKWTLGQGLSTKPRRLRRGRADILRGVLREEKESLPVSISTLQLILTNEFYIGRLRHGDEWIEGSHPPLIDVAKFEKVQALLHSRCVTVKYADKAFFAYRDFIRCSCGRKYTPYRAHKNGEVYYSSKCKDGCDNAQKNLHERHIDDMVQGVLDRIYFSDEELRQIENGAEAGLKRVAAKRNKELEDLNRQRLRILTDLDYLKQNKIRLLREGMPLPEWGESSQRLVNELQEVDAKLSASTETEREMLDYVLSFSELLCGASALYKDGTDAEKRKLTHKVFSELTVKDGILASYKVKENYAILLNRPSVQDGSPGWTRTSNPSVTRYPPVSRRSGLYHSSPFRFFWKK